MPESCCGDCQAAQKEEVRYLEMKCTYDGTFEIYLADSAEEAKAFLVNKNIPWPSYYVVVYTPEGNWGRDCEGIFLERLMPFQKNILKTCVEGIINSMPSMLALEMAARGISDNFVVSVKCGNCRKTWIDGIGYRARTIVKCPYCKAFCKVNSDSIAFMRDNGA